MKRIMVVDDSEMVRNYHRYILKFLGCDVNTAENGSVALEEVLSGNYDLVITDINMPIMDGYELVKNIKGSGLNIPIIIVSTEEEYKTKLAGYDSLANLHIVKPAQPEILIKTVKQLLNL